MRVEKALFWARESKNHITNMTSFMDDDPNLTESVLQGGLAVFFHSLYIHKLRSRSKLCLCKNYLQTMSTLWKRSITKTLFKDNLSIWSKFIFLKTEWIRVWNMAIIVMIILLLKLKTQIPSKMFSFRTSLKKGLI